MSYWQTLIYPHLVDKAKSGPFGWFSGAKTVEEAGSGSNEGKGQCDLK